MMKPTFLQLALRHEEVLGDVWHVARVLPQMVDAVVAGVWVEQAVFDAVLSGLNYVAGTNYTQDDIRGVHILTDADMEELYSTTQGALL
ncbi:MAG TPA: hypothetical protein DHW02_02940 [Ktedonobacter sp.]|nr:hypothetical protein [Ktedonobacter sp.]